MPARKVVISGRYLGYYLGRYLHTLNESRSPITEVAIVTAARSLGVIIASLALPDVAWQCARNHSVLRTLNGILHNTNEGRAKLPET